MAAALTLTRTSSCHTLGIGRDSWNAIPFGVLFEAIKGTKENSCSDGESKNEKDRKKKM